MLPGLKMTLYATYAAALNDMPGRREMSGLTLAGFDHPTHARKGFDTGGADSAIPIGTGPGSARKHHCLVS